MGKLHIGRENGVCICEQRYRYVSFFFSFFLPYTFIRHTLCARSWGYKKRVRLSTVLWELTDVGKLDTQRHDKKSMHIVEQMSNLSEFAKASQNN